MNLTKKTDLSQKFHDRIIGKIVDWVLGQRVAEGKVAELQWNKEEQEVIYKLIDNPKLAGITATVSDPKFRRFFKSVADNGLNTADVAMFYKYRERLPLKKMNWAYDIEDFDFEGDDLVSTQVIREGFYMLEFQSDPSEFQSNLPITLEADFDGQGKPIKFMFSALSSRIVKRLIWLPSDAYLYFSSRNDAALEEVSHLRLSRVTRSFFISRLMKKLGLHFNLAKHGKLDDKTFQDYWEAYDSLFAHHMDLKTAYRIQQRIQEPKAVPSNKKQLFDLSRWLR
jgi:hypothetical protein